MPSCAFSARKTASTVKGVAALERADRDATTAKRFLKVLEKALAIHVADRDRLTKRLAPRGS